MDCWTNPVQGVQTVRGSLLIPSKAFLSLLTYLLNVSRCVNVPDLSHPTLKLAAEVVNFYRHVM